MNLIVVTAGNYKAKTEDDGGGVVDHQASAQARNSESRSHASESDSRPIRALSAGQTRRRPRRLPSRRRPDGEARSSDRAPAARRRRGRARRRGDADAGRRRRDSPASRGVQFVSEGIHENVHASAGDRRWFTRLHGGDVELPSIRRSWTFTARTLLHARASSRGGAGRGARRVRRGEAVRRRQPGRPRDSAVEAAVPGGRRRRQRQLDGGAGRRATISSTRSTCRSRPSTGC